MSRGGWRAAAAALLAVLAALAGMRMYATHRPLRAPREGMSTAVGEASAPGPGDLAAEGGDAPGARTKIPALLPEFSLSDARGKPTSISAWAGESLVINFWATWCAPCRREIPLLEALDGEWAARGVRVIGIAVDERAQVLAFASELKIRYPLLIGEQDALDVAAALGVASPAFPFTVFTDRRGEIVALYVGELHRPQAAFILSVVQSVNAGGLALPDARRRIEQGLPALGAARGG